MSSNETQARTYWCHQCDMSIHLLLTSTTLSNLHCPECNQNNSLELMDPIPNSNDTSSFLLLDDTHFIQHYNCISSLYRDDELTCLNFQDMDSCLPTVKITSLILELDSLIVCAVCKDQFVLDCDAKKLPCNHMFHAQCILPWLNIHSSCPLCRFSVPTPTCSLSRHSVLLGNEFFILFVMF